MSAPSARLVESVGPVVRGSGGSSAGGGGGSGGSGGALLLLDAYADEETQTLVTVAGDRVVRLWDLGVLANEYKIRAKHGPKPVPAPAAQPVPQEEVEGDDESEEVDEEGSEGGNWADGGRAPSRGGGNGVRHVHAGATAHARAHVVHTHGRSHPQHPPQPQPLTALTALARGPPRAPAAADPALRGVCALPCIGRVASPPGTTLPPSLARFVSLAPLRHPRYPFGTFVVAGKSNFIGVVQAADASTGLVGEEYAAGADLASLASLFPPDHTTPRRQRAPTDAGSSVGGSSASVRGDAGGRAATRFSLLHEAPLSVLMHTYLTRGAHAAVAAWPPAHAAAVFQHAMDTRAKVSVLRALEGRFRPHPAAGPLD